MSPALRQHLRDDVHATLSHWIVAGRLTPGRAVGEEALAAELGISRTPLREALIALERDGLVDAIHSRGFVVKPHSAGEVHELYPMLWGLEATAVELQASHKAWDLPELRRLGAKFTAGSSPRTRLRLDTAWHTALIAPCGNARLIAFADRIRLGVRRYELAYMASLGNRTISSREHASIVQALSEHDVPSATALLKQHWSDGQARVLEMIGSGPDDPRRS